MQLLGLLGFIVKTKSDSLAIFKQFQTMFELQFGFKIKSLQTDWRGEVKPFTN
jgi:hypothetical protein